MSRSVIITCDDTLAITGGAVAFTAASVVSTLLVDHVAHPVIDSIKTSPHILNFDIFHSLKLLYFATRSAGYTLLYPLMWFSCNALDVQNQPPFAVGWIEGFGLTV
jgi:hypothetical protein